MCVLTTRIVLFVHNRKSHLAPYLPSHPLAKKVGGEKAFGVVSSAPWGSALILPISYAYIRMMGPQGLRKATQVSSEDLAVGFFGRESDIRYRYYTGSHSECELYDCAAKRALPDTFPWNQR